MMSSIIKSDKKNLLNLLVISLPLFFALGPALIEIVSFIFFVFFVVLYLNKDNDMLKLIKDNRQIINLFFLFWFVLIISSFLSNDYYLSFKNTGFYFRFLCFSLVILYCLNNYEKIKHFLLYAYFFLFFLLFLTSIYEFTTGLNFFNNLPYSNGRISSIFLDEKILGSFIIKSLPIIIALIYFNKIKYNFLIIFVLILISLILITLSGERTALILFSIFFIFLLKFKDFRKIFYIILFSIFCLIIINPKIFVNNSTDRIVKNSLSQAGIPLIGSNERIRMFSPIHEHHYLSGLNMFLKNPILGIGPNNFREECKKVKYFVNKIPFIEEKIYARSDGNFKHVGKYIYFSIDNFISERYADEIEIADKFKSFPVTEGISEIKFKKNEHIFSYKDNLAISGCNTHPHNYLIQFLAETGVVGFLFYISLICFCLYRLILIIFDKNSKNKIPEYLMLVSILLSLFPLLPSGNFFNNMTSFNIFWNLPFYLFFSKNFSR